MDIEQIKLNIESRWVLFVTTILILLTMVLHLIFKSANITTDFLGEKMKSFDIFNFFELRILFLGVEVMNVYVCYFFKAYFNKRIEKFQYHFSEEEKKSINKSLKQMILFILVVNLGILCQEIPIIILEVIRDLKFESYEENVDGIELFTAFESISQFILIIIFGVYTKWSIKSLQLMSEA